MIKVPYEEIVAKIKEKAGLTEEEINSKIKEKTSMLSGLISKEGAAHIVANELGVKIFDDFSGKLKIKNILAGMRDVEAVAKVQRIFDIREFKTETREGKVASIIVGDETGTIRFVFWGSQADNTLNMKEGDIVKIMSGYVRENRGVKEVHLNDRSKIVINPPGETVGEVKTTQQAMPSFEAKRKEIKDLTQQDGQVELLGTIVQAFDPRFFEVCPECGKRARPEDGSFVCAQHGQVNPKYSYVFNVVLDDGTENIRIVFFREQMEKVLGMDNEKLLEYKESPEKFTDVKNNLLGTQIKVTGRPNMNQMFDRLEFVSRDVDPNPSAEKELERLQTAKNDV